MSAMGPGGMTSLRNARRRICRVPIRVRAPSQIMRGVIGAAVLPPAKVQRSDRLRTRARAIIAVSTRRLHPVNGRRRGRIDAGGIEHREGVGRHLPTVIGTEAGWLRPMPRLSKVMQVKSRSRSSVCGNQPSPWTPTP